MTEEQDKIPHNSFYKKEYADQAFKLCLLGAKDTQIAEFFHVTEHTIGNWRKKHKKFNKALFEGKFKADAEVAKSMYQRAKGYSCPETKVFLVDGEDGKKVPLLVQVTKHYPPDPASFIFWLKNRWRDDWRDTQDHNVKGHVSTSVLELKKQIADSNEVFDLNPTPSPKDNGKNGTLISQ